MSATHSDCRYEIRTDRGLVTGSRYTTVYFMCLLVFLNTSGSRLLYLYTRSSWLCTVLLRCRPSKSPRTSLFLQRLLRSASSSPLHCWQPSIFGCWPSGVELPATGGYVGTISGDLPHSTQDVSVH